MHRKAQGSRASSMMLLLLLGSGCSGGRQDTPAPSPAAPAAPSTPVPAAAPASPPAADEAPAEATPTPAPSATRDVAGLTITLGDDGSIRVQGTDRWGGDATTTYETVTFLEGALPTLERSLAPAQIEGLRALITEVRAH